MPVAWHRLLQSSIAGARPAAGSQAAVHLGQHLVLLDSSIYSLDSPCMARTNVGCRKERCSACRDQDQDMPTWTPAAFSGIPAAHTYIASPTYPCNIFRAIPTLNGCCKLSLVNTCVASRAGFQTCPIHPLFRFTWSVEFRCDRAPSSGHLQAVILSYTSASVYGNQGNRVPSIRMDYGVT